MVNNGITNVNKNVDVKFTVISVYCDVATQTFNNENIQLVSSRKCIKNASNLNWLNNCYNIENIYIKTSALFTADCNNFIKSYNNCNSSLFASKLSENINKVSELSDNLSKEEISTYYFKKVMG